MSETPVDAEFQRPTVVAIPSGPFTDGPGVTIVFPGTEGEWVVIPPSDSSPWTSFKEEESKALVSVRALFWRYGVLLDEARDAQDE